MTTELAITPQGHLRSVPTQSEHAQPVPTGLTNAFSQSIGEGLFALAPGGAGVFPSGGEQARPELSVCLYGHLCGPAHPEW